MTTLQITSNSPEAINFLGYARTLPFIHENPAKERATELAPPCQFTAEELRGEVDRAVEARKRGRFISHEEMGKRIASWR
jgi:hypothetical protein